MANFATTAVLPLISVDRTNTTTISSVHSSLTTANLYTTTFKISNEPPAEFRIFLHVSLSQLVLNPVIIQSIYFIYFIYKIILSSILFIVSNKVTLLMNASCQHFHTKTSQPLDLSVHHTRSTYSSSEALLQHLHIQCNLLYSCVLYILILVFVRISILYDGLFLQLHCIAFTAFIVSCNFVTEGHNKPIDKP